MKRFAQTRNWLGIAASSIDISNIAMFRLYDTKELDDYGRAEERIEQLRKQLWELREAVLNVRDALTLEEPNEACNDEVLEERYQMGLMSTEQEADYVFGPKNEMPF